jgi:hypothetical protein
MSTIASAFAGCTDLMINLARQRGTLREPAWISRRPIAASIWRGATPRLSLGRNSWHAGASILTGVMGVIGCKDLDFPPALSDAVRLLGARSFATHMIEHFGMNHGFVGVYLTALYGAVPPGTNAARLAMSHFLIAFVVDSLRMMVFAVGLALFDRLCKARPWRRVGSDRESQRAPVLSPWRVSMGLRS